MSVSVGSGPLTGVRVVEIGVWIAGPAAGGVLADWGANVIKIEPPSGDPARGFPRLLGVRDMPNNPIFELDNRGKQSVVIDIASDDGRELALQLIDRADVFISNIRLKALERLGLDPTSLLQRNPALVYGHISGYGLAGVDADRAAFDVAAFWARSGIASLLAQAEGDLPFQRGGMGDHSTGAQLAGAIAAALFHRERTGEGQLVATSLLRQAVYTIGFDLSMVLGWGTHPQTGDRSTMANPCMNNYRTKDGRRFWIVGLDGERHWPPLARVVGHAEWIEDERFRSRRGRATNAKELIALLDGLFAEHTMEEWSERFGSEPDMFWTVVNDPYEVVNDPQVLAAGGLIDVPDEFGSTTMVATPADFSGTPWAPRWTAPALGHDTASVLRDELGLTDDVIAALAARGVILAGTRAEVTSAE